MIPTDTVDLTNCDHEPIHIPGSIQPHGCMLACDINAGVVNRHSENAAEMLGIPAPINGLRLEQLIGSNLTHSLRNALTTSGEGTRPALLINMALPNGRSFDISLHRYKATTIIEFEPTDANDQPLQLAQLLIGRIREIADVERLTQYSARLIQGTLGYDRVMIYRFEQDGAGKVVAEAKRSDLESFLGQYFPATDIPKQARDLYLKNTLRVISDSNCIRVPIEPQLDASGEPLDLSFAHLRSVSPIHCEYLHNMGVAASMSISVIVNRTLWGLIACHHYSPRALPMAKRIAAAMFGEFFSLHLNALKQKQTLDTATKARASLDNFLRLAAHHADVTQLLVESLDDFARLMPCDGVGLWTNNKWNGWGSTPPAEDIPQLVQFIDTVSEGRVWATHSLTQRLPAAESYSSAASGVLAVPLSKMYNNYLLFFRKELARTVNWAGNPEKTYSTGPLGDRLTPRKSFAIWRETVHQQAQPWTDADREIAEAARSTLVEIVLHHNELLADERSRAEVRQRMLNEELNHRVKNILAIIKSLVGHPIQEGRVVEDYVASLKGRIQALSFAHDQVVRGDGGGSLGELIDAELTPYRDPASRVSSGGPTILLDSRAFSVMALVLHELATNAAKYGALSGLKGILDIEWRLTPQGDCEIHWLEKGVPIAVTPKRSGFGTTLIRRSVPYDLGGRADVDYTPNGMEARFLIPQKHISVVEKDKVSELREAGLMSELYDKLDQSLRVLLVEDQMLIALDVESMLDDHGISGVVAATSVIDALHKLRNFTPDVAILDVNLGSVTSIPVAQELTLRKVPFIFATGYGDSSMIPIEFAAVPVIRKPYGSESLAAALSRVLKQDTSVK